MWTWVPFEEDNSVGKDRPVLLVGSDGDWLLAVMLTSKDHDHDARRSIRPVGVGRRRLRWVGPQRATQRGSGEPDHPGRPRRIRREGAVLARERFEEVATAIRQLH